MAETKREQIVLGITIALILGMLFRFLYLPEMRRVFSLRGELAETLLKSKKAQEFIDKGNDMREEWKLEEKLVVGGEINDILAFLTESAHGVGITLSSVCQQETARREFYSEVPIGIELTGDYSRILAYLTEISTFSRVLQIGSLEIVRDEKERPGLRGKLLMKTYVLSE